MNILEEMDAFSVIICPECGHGGDFNTTKWSPDNGKYNNGMCPECGLYFHIGKVDTAWNGRKVQWKTIYASTEKNFTLDEWEWKMFFFLVDKKPQWQTYSDEIRNKRTDKRPIEEVNNLIEQKWEAHQVMIALRS